MRRRQARRTFGAKIFQNDVMPLGYSGLLILFAAAALSDEAPNRKTAATFHKDVLPILQHNCQGCHRPGQMGPMPLLTYQQARPWAKAIKAAVLSKQMPPWFADAHYGPYLNDKSISQHDVETLVSWADAGAPEGNPKDAPAAVAWPESWLIKPDIIVDGPLTELPAAPKANVIPWMTVIMPTGFTKDTWVRTMEILPSAPAVTHHICIGFAPHREGVKYGRAVWTDRARDDQGAALPDKGPTFGGRSADASSLDPDARAILQEIREGNGQADCYLPGNPAADYRPAHAAKLIPAGWDITFNLHYTPSGTPATDHVKVGFTVAKEPPERQYVSLLFSSSMDSKVFAIPPNNPDWLSPPVDVTFQEDVELAFMMTHMHFRGKDATWTLEYPDGRKQVVLSVPHYDFNWQLGYNSALKIPKGTKLHVDAHFDNSPNNKFNPDPTRTVYYGEMTWEEMHTAFVGLVVRRGVDIRKLTKGNAAGQGG